MTLLNFKDFMKKYNLKIDTMNESQSQRIYNFPIYPRDMKIYSVKAFVNIDKGSVGGNHWTCFILKGTHFYYFESFGSQPDNFSLNQLPKPTTYHNYKTQKIYSKLCGSYCSYFFYLIERVN